MHPTAILLAAALCVAAVLLQQVVANVHDNFRRGRRQHAHDAIRLLFAGGIVWFSNALFPDAVAAVFGVPLVGVAVGGLMVAYRIQASRRWRA